MARLVLKSLRWRLQLWHAAILMVAVTLFGAAFYFQLRRSTFVEIDAELLGGARILEGTLRMLPAAAGKDDLAQVPMNLPQRLAPPGWPPGPPPERSNQPNPPPRGPFPPMEIPYFAVFSANGEMLRSVGEGSEVAWQSPRRPIEFVNSDGRREVRLRGPHNSLIVVGRNIRRQVAHLTEALIQLMVIGISVLSLGLIGGWWMSGRAIQPIRHISQTAAAISAANLTERIDTHDMDRELQALALVLNSMLARLEQAFRQQAQFTADASHELRTPLAVLLSHCELALSRPRSSDEYQRTVETCQKAGQRMKEMVDGLLLLARADAAKLALQFSQVDLHDIALESISLLSPLAEQRQVHLSVAGEATVCQADGQYLLQVVTNLLSNAILYSHAEGNVVIETLIQHDLAVLRVRDDGPGIPAEAIPRLFDRFYRVDQDRSRVTGGSGLGLAICKSIIDAHGGTLQVLSDSGEGAVFEFKVPVVHSSKEPTC